MNKVERALLAAEKAHANQQYDIYPYMYHIKQVLSIACDLGYDEVIQTACVLHDIMEDGDLSYNDIKKNFGEEVAEIVYAVTDELGRNRRERKAKTYPKIRENWKATVVKICDRIANVKHSRAFNQGLYEMYKREHQKFTEALYDSSSEHFAEIGRAWMKLVETLDFVNQK